MAGTTSSALSSRTGDGQVTITFDPATDGCPAAPSSVAPAVEIAPKFTG
jgi:hypothetical protein